MVHGGPKIRWSPNEPCRTCGGSQRPARGQVHCTGFYYANNPLEWCCSRSEYANNRHSNTPVDEVWWHSENEFRGGYGTYVAPRPAPKPKAAPARRPRPRGTVEEEAPKLAAWLGKLDGFEVAGTVIYPVLNRSGDLSHFKIRINQKDLNPETGKPEKTFRLMEKDLEWKLMDGPLAERPLYGSEHLDNAYTTAYIVICEGEKAAQALIDRGIPAVSMPGANAIPSWEVLQETCRGFDRVFFWRDKDSKGEDGGYMLAARFWDNGAELWDLDWKDAPPKGDAYEFFTYGHSDEEFIQLLVESTLYRDLRPSPERMPDDTARGPVRKAYLEELASKQAHAATQADRLAAVLAQMGPEERNDAVMFRWCRTESVKSMDTAGVHRIAQPITCKDTICPKCATGRMLAAWRGKVQNRLDGVRGTLLRIYPKNPLGGANPLRTLAKRWQEHRKVLRQNYALWEGVWGYRWDPDYGGCIMLWTRALVSDMLPYMDAWEIEIVADNCYEAPQFGHWLAIEYDAEFSYILERAEAGDTELLLSWRSWVRGRRRFNGFGKIWRPKKAEDFYFPEKGEDPPDPLLVGLEKGLTSRGDQIEGDNVIVVLGRIVGGNRAPKTPQICPGCELKEQVGVRRGYERMLTVDTAQAQGPGGYYLTYFG